MIFRHDRWLALSRRCPAASLHRPTLSFHLCVVVDRQSSADESGGGDARTSEKLKPQE